MAVEIVAKMKPKNNGKFKLMDCVDIETKSGVDLQTYLDNLQLGGGGEGGGGGVSIDTIMDNNIIYYGMSSLETINEEIITGDTFTKTMITPTEEQIINFYVKETKQYLYLVTPFILGEPIAGFTGSRFLGNGGLDWGSKRGEDSYQIIFLPNSKGIMQGYIVKRSDWKLGINKNIEVYFYFEGKEDN